MNSDERNGAIVGSIMAFFIPIFVVLLAFWPGFVGQTLWNWFANPFTAIKLTFGQAVGAVLLLTFIRGYRTTTREGDKTSLWPMLTVLGTALVVGFIVHNWVR